MLGTTADGVLTIELGAVFIIGPSRCQHPHRKLTTTLFFSITFVGIHNKFLLASC